MLQKLYQDVRKITKYVHIFIKTLFLIISPVRSFPKHFPKFYNNSTIKKKKDGRNGEQTNEHLQIPQVNVDTACYRVATKKKSKDKFTGS